MSIEQISFYFLAFVALLSAVMVVTIRNLVRSIFLFFLTLFSLAGLYVFAMADFIAITQVVIYVGGVLVLMLFAFMLSDKDLLSVTVKNPGFSIKNFPAILLCFLFLLTLFIAIRNLDWDNLPWIIQASVTGNEIKASNNTINNIGIQTMTRYLLPFEVVSIVLLMVLIGAAHLTRKESKH